MSPLSGEIPEPPSDIKGGSEGRRYWRHYWKTAGEWLVSADYPLVVRLCRLVNLAERLQQGIDEDGLYAHQSDKENARHTAHPMLGELHRVFGQIERLEDRLGLNPVERSRIRITPKEKESALDRWAGRSTTDS